MAVLLTILVVVVIGVIVVMQDKQKAKERQDLAEACQTMSLEELLAKNDAFENEWREWNAKWAKKLAWKRDSSTELNNRKNAGLKLDIVRKAIKERYPNVITDSERLKQKAHSLANSSEKNKMKSLESKLDSSYRSLRASGITGGQLLENTHSSVIRGAAASTLVGPITGGITYAATEAQNKAITNSNLQKRAENAVFDSMANSIEGTQKQLNDLYTEIVHKHNEKVMIHIYGLKYY